MAAAYVTAPGRARLLAVAEERACRDGVRSSVSMEVPVADWVRIVRSALVSGTAASATSTVALALLARAEGKAALQPVNSTSHWLNGDRAGAYGGADLTHTAVGYATHHAATVFWAVLFERWLVARRPREPAAMLRDALALSAVAAVVDYRATPKRFTPGWEFVLSKPSMAATYVAMAVGLAAGGLLTQRTRRQRSVSTGARRWAVARS